MRPGLALIILGLIGLISSVPVGAQSAVTGAIEGVVSTQNGAVRLPGVLIAVHDSNGAEVSQQVTDAEGRVRVAELADGRYRVTATLEGFQSVESTVIVAGGRSVPVLIDLPFAMATRVEVTAPRAGLGGSETLGTTEALKDKESDQYTPGGGFQAALRLLASVIQVPGGLSIKGGRPNQSSVQIGAGTLIDPSTGLVALTLPADAIDSVSVLPNPYAVEFGRFSSGLVVINTRRAGDQWHVNFNNFDPGFRTKRNEDYKITGLGVWAPRLEIGGPLIKNRLFLEETAQYRYTASEVASRPESELRTSQWFSTFTRLDGILSPRHSFVATGGFFPSRTDQATLGTFTPPDAAVDIHEHIGHGAFSERAVWSETLLTESTVRFQQDDIDVDPRGSQLMQLLPETTNGNFFNRQSRMTATYQWINTVSATHDGPGGLHLLKFGVDLLHSGYEGSSASAPVIIENSNGTPVRRLDFSGPTMQQVRSTDVALFAQDRLQPGARWYLEFGGRIDRDGVLDRVNVTPRLGTAVLLDKSGDAILRGGYGLFYERTPSLAGAFSQFENEIDTRFEPDGVTPLGPPVTYAHTIAPDLRTSRSATWNVAYDHRLNASWSLHTGLLSRESSHELLVRPFESDGVGELRLSSDGRSVYKEAEIGLHFTHAPGVDVNATYVRSSADGDLNTFTSFFGAVLSPVISTNAYAPIDVPNRLLVRGRMTPGRWLFVGVADWRSGFPYSIVDSALDYVGPRNIYRFPNTLRVELGVERKVRLLKWDPWVGVRVNNAFNAFLPTDVQANTSSPAFGTFYNSEIRQFRLMIRFER